MKYSKFLKKVLVSIITCFMFVGFAPTVRAVETYTVTYTDGSSSEKYFPDQVYTVNAGDLVPAFEGTPTRDGWVFTTWNATYKNGEQTVETVTKNRTFSARWVKMPNHLDTATAVHATIRATDEFRQYGGFDLRDFTLIADTFTVNETVWNEERGCMTASVTITDIKPYEEKVTEKYGHTYVFNSDKTPEENLTIHFINRLNYKGSSSSGNLQATFGGWILDSTYYPGGVRSQLIFNREYDITFKDSLNGTIFADKEVHILESSGAGTPFSVFGNDPTRIGYKFNGWTSQNNNLTEDKTKVEGDDVLTAQWLKMNDVTIAFNANGGNTIDPVTVQYGERYSFPSSPLSGYSQNGWYLYDNGQIGEFYVKGGKSKVVETEDSLSLIMARKVLAPSVEITLTTEAEEIGDNYQFYYPKNSTRILTAEVTEYNDLDYTYEWFKDGVKIEGENDKTLRLAGNVGDSGTYSVTVTAAQKDGSNVIVTEKSASASASQKVKIMKTANSVYYDANGGEGGPTNNFTNANEIVVAASQPTRIGYTFESWNTKADGSGESYKAGETIALNDNGNGGVRVDLYAQWKPITFTVSFGDDAPAQSVDYGKTVVKPADPKKEGYTFVGWFNGDKEYDFGTPVTSDLELIAKFEKNNVPVDPEKPVDDNTTETPQTPNTGDTNMYFYYGLTLIACAGIFFARKKASVK